MRRFSRVLLIAVPSVVFASAGFWLGVAGAGAGSAAPVAIHSVASSAGRVAEGKPSPYISNNSADYDRLNYEAAAKLATPQNIANAFAFTQGIATIKP